MLVLIGFRFEDEIYGLYRPLDLEFPIREIRVKINDKIETIPEIDFIYEADFRVVIGYRYNNKIYKLTPEYRLYKPKESLRVKRENQIYTIPEHDFIYEHIFKKFVGEREIVEEVIYSSDEDDNEPINIMDDNSVDYGTIPMDISDGMSDVSDDLYNNPFSSYKNVKFDIDLVDDATEKTTKPIKKKSKSKIKKKPKRKSQKTRRIPKVEDVEIVCGKDAPIIGYTYRFKYYEHVVCIDYGGILYKAYWKKAHMAYRRGNLVRIRGHYVRNRNQ